MSGERETWTNRLGFIFAAIGGSIGLGNIWRFPHIAGTMGGGAFLLTFFIILVTIGAIGLMIELGFGRAFQGGPFTAIRKSGLPGGKVIAFLPPLAGQTHLNS